MKTTLGACALLLLVAPFSAAGAGNSHTEGDDGSGLRSALTAISKSKGPADSGDLAAQLKKLRVNQEIPTDGPVDLDFTSESMTESADSKGGNATKSVTLSHFSIHLEMKDGKIAGMQSTLTTQTGSVAVGKEGPMGAEQAALKAKPVSTSWAFNMPMPALPPANGTKFIPSQSTKSTALGTQPSPLQEQKCGSTVSPSTPGCAN